MRGGKGGLHKDEGSIEVASAVTETHTRTIDQGCVGFAGVPRTGNRERNGRGFPQIGGLSGWMGGPECPPYTNPAAEQTDLLAVAVVIGISGF